MIEKLIPFTIIYVSQIFIASMIAVYEFRESILNYRTVPTAMRHLFLASLGEFDYDAMVSYDLLFSEIFFVVFLMLNAILLLNLLIALLLEDYSDAKLQSKAIYLQWKLELENLWIGNEYYGALTFKNAALAGLNLLVFAPLSLLRSKRINRCF